MAPDLLAMLANSTLDLEQALYRGTDRHQQLKVGDVHSYPSSWAFKLSNALNFINEGGVVFALQPCVLHAIVNHYNSYGENEVIVAPFSFTVVKKETRRGPPSAPFRYTLMEVELRQ